MDKKLKLKWMKVLDLWLGLAGFVILFVLVLFQGWMGLVWFLFLSAVYSAFFLIRKWKQYVEICKFGANMLDDVIGGRKKDERNKKG